MSDIRKPPYVQPPDPQPPKPGTVKRHRRWIVHSHEASRPAHTDAKSDINITPLIDVMLVLLIIFMVVTPLAQRGLDIALPAPDTSKPNEPQRPPGNEVVLSVEEAPGGGSVMSINKNPVASVQELEQKLRDIYQTRSDKTIFVRGSGKVAYGRIVEAMDAAKGAGVERIGIISEKMLQDAGAAPTGSPGQ
jgi:biopolymer transport protein ExbD/biopolymer transport protein TolR